MNQDSLRSIRALISKGADITCYVDEIVETRDSKLLDSLFISLLRKYCKDLTGFFKCKDIDDTKLTYGDLKPGYKASLQYLTEFKNADSDVIEPSVLFGCSPFVPKDTFPAFVDSTTDKCKKFMDACGKDKQLVELKRRQSKDKCSPSIVELTPNKRLLYEYVVELGVPEPFCGILTKTGQFSRNTKFIDCLEESVKPKVIALREYCNAHPGCRLSKSLLLSLTN
jgi:hypothetical protein